MDCITKALVMCDLSLAQEFDGIAYIGIIHQTQNVIVGYSCFLFSCNCIRATFKSANGSQWGYCVFREYVFQRLYIRSVFRRSLDRVRAVDI